MCLNNQNNFKKTLSEHLNKIIFNFYKIVPVFLLAYISIFCETHKKIYTAKIAKIFPIYFRTESV